MKKILCALLGMLLAGTSWSATLPAGYTELEYIESTGTQYIDTGYKPSNNTKIDMTVSFASVANGHIFGSRMTNTGGGGFAVATITNIFAFDYNGDRVYGISPTVGTVYRIVKNGAENQISYGTTVNTYSNSASTFSVDATMALFGINTAGTITSSAASIKIYSAQIEESGVLVRDFVPARRDNDGVIGMYDMVNNEFYTNQGTGTFTAGPEVSIRIATTAYNSARFSPVVTELNDTIATIRSVVTNTINQTKAIADLQATKQTRPNENCPAGKKCLLVEDNDGMPHWYEIIENAYGLPSGYTGLEYIQSTGTQYIDTGISITSGNFQIDADMQFTSIASPQYFGIFGGGYFGITDNYFAAGGRTISKSADTQRHKFIFSSIIGTNVLLNLSIDGTNYNISRDVSAGRINLLVVDNRGALMGETKAKLYSAQIYSNGTLVRDMIPAKNASGVIGMYDTVSGQFFTNAGSGTFTAGPEI